jgi:hypothetical protein
MLTQTIHPSNFNIHFAEHGGSDAIYMKKYGAVGKHELGRSSSRGEVARFSHL